MHHSREELFMEEALAAIRRVMTEEKAGEETLTPTEPRTSGEDAGTKPKLDDDRLLSREATDAVSLAVNRLAENVKKHERTLEEVVREALRPMLRSWIDKNLHDVVERMVRPEIERAIRGR
jgi:cell pole-organizing protein PopZ